MWASAPGATEAGSGEGWSGLPWPCQAPSPPAPRADSTPVCARPGLGVHPPAFSSAASSPRNPSSRTGLCHRARGAVTVSSGSGAGQRAVGLSGGLGFSSWGPRDGGKSWWRLWASVPHRRLGSPHRLPACSPGPWGQRGASEGAWLWTTVPSGDGDGARRAASSTQLPPPLARTPGRASSKAEASSRGRGLAALTNGPGGGPGGAPSPRPAPRNSHLHSPLHALAPELYHANVRACGKAENTLRGTSAGSRLDGPAPATSCGAAEHRTKSCHLNLSEVHTSAALSTFTRLGRGHPFQFQNAVAAPRKPHPPPPRPRIRHCLYLRLACPGHSLSADCDLPGLALFTRHRVPEVRPPRGASGPRSRLR